MLQYGQNRRRGKFFFHEAADLHDAVSAHSPRIILDGYGPLPGVYMIHAPIAGKVKIGWSRDACNRLMQLMTNCPELPILRAVLDLDREGEKNLHARFKQHRRFGEWFTEDVLDFVDDYPKLYP